MKPLAHQLILVALLFTACAPAATSQTSEVAETSEVLPSPTSRPTETLIPTSTEIAATPTAQSLKYTPDELASFPGGVTEQEITIGDETQNALVGLQQDGTIDRVLALEINGQMTRVGEWTDAEGHTFYVYVNPDYDPLHRILATEQTPETLTNFLFEALATGQFASQASGSGDALKKILFNKDYGGRVSLDLPVADPDTDDWAVKWIPSETEADFSKPIEVLTVFGKDADEFMKTSPLAKYIMDFRGDNSTAGGLIWVAEDGHVQIIIIDEAQGAADGLGWVPKNSTEKKDVEKRLYDRVGWSLLGLVNTLSRWGDVDTFHKEDNYPQYDSTSRVLFKFFVELK